MHPELINALARQRRTELLRDRALLRERHFRDSPGDGSPSPGSRRRAPVHHLRRAMGSALVAAGTRLMPRNPSTADWAVHTSRRSTVR